MATTGVIVRMDVETSTGIETIEFLDDDIVSAHVVNEINPPSLELPVSQIEFQVYSTDPRFSLFSDGVFEQAFTQRQRLQVFELFENEEQHNGDYFLEEWNAESEYMYRFVAVDIIGVLEKITYDGGFWQVATAPSVVLDSILAEHNIPYTLTDITVTDIKGWIKPGTVREAIHQVAFALGATVTTTSNGGLEIKAMKLPIDIVEPDLSIKRRQKIDRQNVNRLQMTTAIELISHEYTQDPTTEPEVIYDAVLAPGDYKVVFNKPYYDVSVEGVGFIAINLATEYGDSLATEGLDEIVIDGGYVYGPNYLYLSVAEPGGQVIVSGYPWVDSMRSHILSEDVIASGASNAIKIDTATLVSLSNVDYVLNKLQKYYRQRFVQEATVIKKKSAEPVQTGTQYGAAQYGTFTYEGVGVDSNLSLLKVNDCVDIQTMHEKNIRGIVERMETDLTGGMLATLTIRGVEI